MRYKIRDQYPMSTGTMHADFRTSFSIFFINFSIYFLSTWNGQLSNLEDFGELLVPSAMESAVPLLVHVQGPGARRQAETEAQALKHGAKAVKHGAKAVKHGGGVSETWGLGSETWG
jgi:hypothetical protein